MSLNFSFWAGAKEKLALEHPWIKILEKKTCKLRTISGKTLFWKYEINEDFGQIFLA